MIVGLGKKALVRPTRKQKHSLFWHAVAATYKIFSVGANLWAVWSASSSEEQHPVVNVDINTFSTL